MQVWVAFIAAYPLIKGLTMCLKHRYFSFLHGIEQGYRYNSILRMLLELYLEMTLFAFMNLYSLQYGTLTKNLATFLALVAMALLTYFPAFTMTLITGNSHRL